MNRIGYLDHVLEQSSKEFPCNGGAVALPSSVFNHL